MRLVRFILPLLLLVSCKKTGTTPFSVQNKDIFSVSESTVTDNSDISFNLTQQGTYIIKLVDKNTDQVLTKEKIAGRAGLNTIKIYTRTLTVKYLYLVLCDEGGNQINKTTIITN